MLWLLSCNSCCCLHIPVKLEVNLRQTGKKHMQVTWCSLPSMSFSYLWQVFERNAPQIVGSTLLDGWLESAVQLSLKTMQLLNNSAFRASKVACTMDYLQLTFAPKSVEYTKVVCWADYLCGFDWVKRSLVHARRKTIVVLTHTAKMVEAVQRFNWNIMTKATHNPKGFV